MSRAVEVDAGGIGVRVSSPDREVFPGISKLDVVRYYCSVGPLLLRQVRDRPTALERWPQGVAEGAEHFYQKHLAAKVPDYVDGVQVTFPSGRTGRLLRPTSVACLAWAAQMGTITLHSWPVTAPEVDHPDQLRLDLDPSPANDFASVVQVAQAAQELLNEWQLSSFVKTSGSRGLHVFVPITPVNTFIEVRHAAIAVGRELERRLPHLVTMSWWKEERGDRVFIDFNQNAQDRLIASAYSLRAVPDARVSMPVKWDDLSQVDPAAFTVRTVTDGAVDAWDAITGSAASLQLALAAWNGDVEAGLPELPYPPDFPKMPGEPPRVQPSRARRPS